MSPKAYSTTAVTGGTVAGAGTFDIGVLRQTSNLVTNGDFETGDPATGWTSGLGTCSQSTTQVKVGTYSEKLISGAAGIAWFYQDISSPENYARQTVTMTCWVWCATASKAFIQIDDTAGSTASSYHTGDSTWQQLSVSRVMNGASFQISLRVVLGTITAYFDYALLTNPKVVGMMTRKDARSVPAYQVFDDEYLASQFFTGEPGYGSLPSEKEIAIRQDDWRSGFGLEVYDSSDNKRYRTSTMDMRFRGMGIAGTKESTVARNQTTVTAARVPFSKTIAAGTNFYEFAFRKQSDQSWNSPTSATDTGAGWTDDALVYDGDTATYAYTAAATGWTEFLELNIASITIDAVRYWFVGTYVTIIDIDLYYNSQWNHYFHGAVGGGGAWITVTQAAATSPCHADFNSQHYISMGASLLRLNAGGTGFDVIQTFTATITALEVFGSNLFIALGTSTNYQYMDTSEAFTESTATVKTFKYFKTVNAATPVLWGSDSDNTVRSTINPVNGGTAWSAVTTIASSGDAITGLFSDVGSFYVNKKDIPYYLDSTGAVKNDLAPELATLARSTDNGKSATFWLHKYYLPWGSSLLENGGGVNTWRSPNDYSTQLADFVGQVFAVAGDDHYLFAIIDNSTKIEVLSGRSESIDGTTRWVWHPINETTLTGCESAWVSSVYQKRLWISSTSSSDSLYYIPLPVAYGNVLADANRSFQTGTTMETSWLHGNFRSTVKSFIKLIVEMGHPYDADIYFTEEYKKLEDTGWTTIGNYTGSATSMIQSRYIPVDASSNNPKSTLFKLRFTAVTNDTTKTPVLLNYQLKAVLYPDQREIIALKVYCANEIILRDGGKDQGSYQTIINTLDEARTATYPVTLYDWDGTARVGKFLPLPSGVPRWSPITNEANRQYEREYNLLFQLIPVS